MGSAQDIGRMLTHHKRAKAKSAASASAKRTRLFKSSLHALAFGFRAQSADSKEKENLNYWGSSEEPQYSY
jgi:hypothetical protein